ncbi:uncharacterized protein LOC123672444 isoform X2 [Harmonia axyridis]|uniref:uncharacterized protein LOC123672444 isoform X2 n=1 Tax=Harmonia axyridis TaxID=115357 RepID=UPI001E277FE5|nr:uncharacterized protein LOC123672444 isoform X2 [Harmonia axyridis]
MSSLLEKRTAVITLHNAGKQPSEILKQLRGVGVTRLFVYRTLKRYRETGDVVDRVRTGRPRVVRTKKNIKAVRERIRRNPVRKQKVMAREMKISARSMSRILRDDLGMRAYKRFTGHLRKNQESTETNTEEIILPDSPSSVQSFKRSEPSSISQAPKRITISRNTPLGFYVDESRESLKKTVNTNNYRSDDQYDAFAKHISAQLRELPIRSFIILQGQIQDLINRERLAQLLPQQDMQQQYDCIPSTSHSDSLEFSQELKEEITIEYDI